MEKGNQKFQYFVTFAVSIAAVTAGVSMSWSTPVVPKFHDNQTTINTTDSEISWMVSIASPGFMTGSLVTRFISDRFGRRATLLTSPMCYVVGTIFILLASKAWMLYVTRFLWGCSTGMIVTVATLYIAEIAAKEIRGSLSICIRFMLSFGSFVVMAVGPFVSYQALSYMLLVMPIIYFVVCWWIPETPYHHLKTGHVARARKVLRKLNGWKNKKTLEDKLISMQEDVRKETRRSGSLKELFTGKQYRRAVIIVVGLKVTQIMAGSLAIQQYLGRIIQESKSNMSVSTALIVFGAVRFLVGIMSSVLVDRIGRRPLLIYSYMGTGIGLASTGTYFFLQQVDYLDQDTLSSFGALPFIVIVCTDIIATLGFNSVVYVMPAELFPLNIKSVAMTSCNILGGLLNFIAVKVYQQIRDASGVYGVFWFYATASLLGFMFSLFIVPETKGKSLREIQIELQGDLYDDSEKQASTGVEDVNETTELKEGASHELINK